MRIEMDQDQPVIDARELGKLLDLDPADVRAKMRAGQITSRFETGEGEDASACDPLWFEASYLAGVFWIAAFAGFAMSYGPSLMARKPGNTP